MHHYVALCLIGLLTASCAGGARKSGKGSGATNELKEKDESGSGDGLPSDNAGNGSDNNGSEPNTDDKPLPLPGKPADDVGQPSADAGSFQTVVLVSRSGSNAKGKLRLTEAPDGVTVTGTISGLTPKAQHGFHVHEKGDCSSSDAVTAGGHFNPGARHAVAAENAGSGGADHEETRQRNDRRNPRQAALRFLKAALITFTKTGN